MTWNYCGGCKHFAQGENSSFCDNEKQKDKNKKEYVYYNFSCGLFKDGIHQSRVDYMEKINNKKTQNKKQ